MSWNLRKTLVWSFKVLAPTGSHSRVKTCFKCTFTAGWSLCPCFRNIKHLWKLFSGVWTWEEFNLVTIWSLKHKHDNHKQIHIFSSQQRFVCFLIPVHWHKSQYSVLWLKKKIGNDENEIKATVFISFLSVRVHVCCHWLAGWYVRLSETLRSHFE